MRSPPEQELLGAMTSHGPSRECYKPSRKSRGRPAEASVVPAACCSAASTVSAQGLRAELSAATAAAALLQGAVPESGARVVAVEGPRALPGQGGGQTET